MAYTFTKKADPVEPGQMKNFGNLANDGSNVAMMVAAGVQTQDATGTPVVSPQAFPATVTTINVPLNAIRFHIIPLTNTINISEADNTVATNYFTAPVGIETKFECARQGKIYLKANTGAATGSSFWFDVV